MLKEKCVLCKVVCALVIIGALNWGLVGIADYNLVDHIFGVESVASRIIYTVVGLAGLAMLVGFFKGCPKCRECEVHERHEREIK
ncbi:MAG: DUF378 domain-containing protein [Parachlamydiaceae bacterium]|nr:DUF378 domain-containing protein [Parachlamydiaceae bacterium]